MIKVENATYWLTLKIFTNKTTEIAIPQWMVIETHITQTVSPATCSELPSINLQEFATVYREISLIKILDIFCELLDWKPEAKIDERKLVKKYSNQ